MAWGGWSSLKEVQRYTKSANRKRLALQAAGKLKVGTELANLETPVSQSGEKALIIQGEQIELATPAGFEPATFSLEFCCSTAAEIAVDYIL